jgi:putative hydrolase of the HAD superfamily
VTNLAVAIFDLDQTLLDQRSAANAAAIAWAADHGIADADVASRWSAIATRHYRRYQSREIGFEDQRRERVREFLALTLSDDEASSIFNGYLERYEAGWRLFEDAVPALRRAAAAGLRVAILTNGERSQQQRKLERFSLDAEIDLILCSSDLPAGKPDPRTYAAVTSHFGASSDEAIMIGDSLEADYQGALASGMRARLLDRDDKHRSIAHGRITSLEELVFAN